MTLADQFKRADFEHWVDRQTAFGPRRTGSRGGRANEDFLEETLRSFGLHDVRREPISVTSWESESAKLDVDGRTPDVFAIPYTAFTPAEGVKGRLVYADAAKLVHTADWRDRVVVADITFPDIDTKLLLKLALDAHDPDGTLGRVDHPATWVRQGWHLYHLAAKRGAKAFVGILRNQPGGTARMYAPYGFREVDIHAKPIPGLWIGRGEGELLREQAHAGMYGSVLSTGAKEATVAHNIVAEIPGHTDEAIVLHSHHDSPFTSPVEDASGISVVLELTKHLAATPKRRRRVVVLLSAGHFYGSIGTREFIARHRRDLVPKVALEISIEHAAKEAVEDHDGRLVPSGLPEAAALFMSVNNALISATKSAAEANALDRIIMLPAEGPLGDYPPTDGGDWHEAGVPLVNYICNPVYLLTDEDARSWVDFERMPKIAATFADLIDRVDAMPVEALRARDRALFRKAMTALRHVSRWKSTAFGFKPLW